MSRTRSHLEQQSLQALYAESGEPVTRFDTAVEVLLSALLVFMPFALGVVAPRLVLFRRILVDLT